MQKKFEILMVACLFICSFFLARAGAAYVCAKNLNTKNLCIVLDAGHGGADPGKVGCNDILEKDVNLSIVLKLKTLFENKGFHVVLTREEDTLITENMPVMTISIHQNSFPDASISGPQVFYFEQSKEGAEIASVLQESLNSSLNPPKPRACKANDDYYILKKTPTPTVIVECGFLSNETEAQQLTDESYQEKLARAIYSGTLDYLTSSATAASTE